jgi:hypothetical protein
MHMVGVTFEQIAKAVGKDEVWVAALMYGQVSFHHARLYIIVLTAYRTGESDTGATRCVDLLPWHSASLRHGGPGRALVP